MDVFQLLTALVVIAVAGALLWGFLNSFIEAAKDGYLARLISVGLGTAALLYAGATGSWVIGISAVAAVVLVFKITG